MQNKGWKQQANEGMGGSGDGSFSRFESFHEGHSIQK